MILYHGTGEHNLASILKDGLLPRNMRKIKKGNWKSMPSNPNATYLTSVYAPYFAFGSTTKKGERWVILEIDTDKLDQNNLCPDEDFLEQATRGTAQVPEAGVGMKARTMWFRNHIREFFHLFHKSIRHMGTCCYYGKIPLEAVNKIVLFDPKVCASMTLICLDPLISIVNFRFMEAKYKAVTDWMMGRDISDQYGHFINIMASEEEQKEGIDYLVVAQKKALEVVLER